MRITLTPITRWREFLHKREGLPAALGLGEDPYNSVATAGGTRKRWPPQQEQLDNSGTWITVESGLLLPHPGSLTPLVVNSGCTQVEL